MVEDMGSIRVVPGTQAALVPGMLSDGASGLPLNASLWDL